jgi:hypothetical protein
LLVYPCFKQLLKQTPVLAILYPIPTKLHQILFLFPLIKKNSLSCLLTISASAETITSFSFAILPSASI